MHIRNDAFTIQKSINLISQSAVSALIWTMRVFECNITDEKQFDQSLIIWLFYDGFYSIEADFSEIISDELLNGQIDSSIYHI